MLCVSSTNANISYPCRYMILRLLMRSCQKLNLKEYYFRAAERVFVEGAVRTFIQWVCFCNSDRGSKTDEEDNADFSWSGWERMMPVRWMFWTVIIIVEKEVFSRIGEGNGTMETGSEAWVQSGAFSIGYAFWERRRLEEGKSYGRTRIGTIQPWIHRLLIRQKGTS